MNENQPNDSVLEVNDLKKYFQQNQSIRDMLFGEPDYIQAVDGVSLDLEENEVVGVIGESGCGKSTLLMTLLLLHDKTDGTIEFEGREVGDLSFSELQEYRSEVQLIMQDPFDSHNPSMTVEDLLREPLEIHDMDDHEERIHQILKDVRLDPPESYLDRRPGQLSGGELQRISIARALILEPSVILADEPVSMLDVSTQASVLNLVEELIEEYEVSMLYISHDLSTISYICDRVHVMYLGRFVETAPTEELLSDPKHPYTEALINAIPLLNPDLDRSRTNIEGSTPTPTGEMTGCRFKDRCPERMDVCDRIPPDFHLDESRTVACHLYSEEEAGRAPSVEKRERGEL